MSSTAFQRAERDADAWAPLPEIDLRQLLRLTDDTGMFQHATHLLPDPTHGYCTDDNARALIAAVLHANLRGYDEHTVPLHRYLAFVAYAFNPDNGRFRNFMSYDRRWLEDAGSEDSHGRAMWALGVTFHGAPTEPVRRFADQLFHKGLGATRDQLHHIRPWAFALLGLNAYLKANAPDQVRQPVRAVRDELAEKLFAHWQAHAEEDWPWWEDTVTWGIARLPHALLVSGQAMNRRDMTDAGLKTLQWSLDVQTAPDGHLSIVGNQGWLPRGGEKAKYDQQPLEACALVEACLTAADITGDEQWIHRAWRCFHWFVGDNDMGATLYHAQTGGCHDGLTAHGPNDNQGAESSLAYLLSVLSLHHDRECRAGRLTAAAPRTLGLATVGASSFARFCLDQWASIQDLKPVAVWSRTSSRAETLADDRGIKAYRELRDLAHDPDIHLVHVATTPAHHAEHAVTALRAGKHVICEKPLATNLVDAQRMIQAATERDRRIAVNLMMRFSPMVAPVRAMIDNQLLGAPLRAVFTNRAGDAGLPPDHWFWDPAVSGGIFIEHGVHHFDLAHHWLGDGQLMHAWQLRRPGAPGAHLLDQAGCDIRFGEQTTASFYHGFHQPPALDEQDIRITFERGELRLRGWVPADMHLDAALDENSIEQLRQLFPDAALETRETFTNDVRRMTFRHRTQTVDRAITMRWTLPEDKQTIYGSALRALMEDMLAAIHDPRRPLRVTTDDARRALETAVEATRRAGGAMP